MLLFKIHVKILLGSKYMINIKVSCDKNIKNIISFNIGEQHDILGDLGMTLTCLTEHLDTKTMKQSE